MAKKMPGCISQRSNGKWFFNIPDGKDPVTGSRKSIYQSGFATQEDAEAARAKVLLEKDAGIYVDQSRISVNQYFDNWLQYKKGQVRFGTYIHYETMIRNHVKPRLGQLLLKDVKQTDLVNFYTRLANGDKPISNRYVVHIHRILHDAFEYATTNLELIKKNVVKQVKPPRPIKKEMSVWNKNQLSYFLNVARNDQYYIAFLLAATTGMRMGEIIALRWKDLSINSGQIAVRQTISKGPNGKIFGEPKTKSSKRTISIPQMLVLALQEHKNKQDERKKTEIYKDSGHIIQTSRGTPVIPRNLSRNWYKLLEKSELPVIRFHDLRHTHASLLLQAGEMPKIISERLGHASIEVTMDVYSHLMPNMQESAALRVEQILGSHITIDAIPIGPE